MTKDYRRMRIRVIPAKEGKEILKSIYQQAFPQVMDPKLFVLNYSYAINNYLVPEEAKNSIYDPISLTKSDLMNIYFDKFDFPVNGWDVYNFRKEFKRQGLSERDRIFRGVC